MHQPRIVQPVDLGDPLDPTLAPAREPDTAGGTVDEATPLVRPAPLKDHLAVEFAGQPLVGREAVADQDHDPFDRSEQGLRDLGAARGIDEEVERVPADRGPQPCAVRPAFVAQRLDAPGGFVGVAQRRLVLVREDRLGQRLEQRHEALDAVGQRPRRDGQPHVGQPGRDSMQGAAVDEALEEDAHPYADPVRRVVEQPRHRGRRHFLRRRGALAGSEPARPDDSVLVGLDLDFDQRGATLAVGDIGLAATRTHARIFRGVALLGALLEPGPPGAAVTGSAALLAALAPRTWLLLPLALAPEHRPRQHRPGRPELLELDLQRLDARRQRRLLGLQIPHLGAQPGVCPAQRRD